MANNINPYLNYYIGFKTSLLCISIFNHVEQHQDFSTLLIVNILSVIITLINYNTLYDAFFLVIEFFIGLLMLGNWNSVSLIEKIIIVYNMIPVLSIWLIVGIGCLIHGYNSRAYQRAYDRNHSSASYSKKNSTKINLIELDKEYQCSICYQMINNFGFSICENEHLFHQDCIKEWIKVSITANCPYCRQ